MINRGGITFWGWWDKNVEIDDCPEPWELFEIVLYGQEAGDYVTDGADVIRILDEAGVKISMPGEKSS